ncbi:F-box/kelch-repeat protein At3g06240-like [Mercurialis annua]|uniref:F-box/kelch-repeat protein At3g06240-like n=1 Tax=Mercurialis annua TaxID=3986 RepID=UPI0024AFF4E7|nr:F-box/kelch-repeat protein At3g06240-like [Mercurialis annua]
MSNCFDSTTNDFKVWRLLSRFDFESRPNAKAEVYSLNAVSWKNISHITPQYRIPSSFIFKRQSIPFVNGALHMIACDCTSLGKGTNLVLVFDVKDENFREILLPDCLMNYDSECMLFVIAYGQSIAVVHIYETAMKNDIWVMKEYGVYNSWTNLGKLHNEDRASAAMFFRKNGQFMMDSFGKFFSFDFATQSFTHLFPDLEEIKAIQGTVGTVERWPASVFTYMETLALLDRGNLKMNQASRKI